MKRNVLLIGVLLIFAVVPNAKANNPLEMFPVTSATLQPTSEFHSCLQPQYLYKFNKPAKHAEFKRILKGFILGEPACMQYFQQPENQRLIIQKEMSVKYTDPQENRLLSFEEIAAIIDRSTFQRTPDDLKSKYALLRLKDDGSYDFKPRVPYREGDYIDNYRGYAPEDEYSLMDGTIVNFQVCCGNYAENLLPDEPDHVYDQPEVTIPPAADTGRSPSMSNQQSQSTTIKIEVDDKRKPAKHYDEEEEDDRYERRAPKKEKRDSWARGASQIAAGVLVGGFGAIVLGEQANKALDKKSKGRVQQRPVYSNQWPRTTSGPVYTGQDQQGGSGSYPNNGGSTTTTDGGGTWATGNNGSNTNTWLKAPTTQNTVVAANRYVAPVRTVQTVRQL